MSMALPEIEAAADALSDEEKLHLISHLAARLRSSAKGREFSRGTGSHSILDIPTVSLGGMLRPLTSDDDLLGEMLDDQP
jgi:hypothetical protein